MSSKSNAAEQIAEALGKTLVCATGRNLSPQAAGHLQRAVETIVALPRGAPARDAASVIEHLVTELAAARTDLEHERGQMKRVIADLKTTIAERDAAQAELVKLSDTVIGVATGASEEVDRAR